MVFCVLNFTYVHIIAFSMKVQFGISSHSVCPARHVEADSSMPWAGSGWRASSHGEGRCSQPATANLVPSKDFLRIKFALRTLFTSVYLSMPRAVRQSRRNDGESLLGAALFMSQLYNVFFSSQQMHEHNHNKKITFKR